VQIRIVQDAATRFLRENTTTVLTAGGVVGTVATGVLAFRAGFKSAEIIETERKFRYEDVAEDQLGDIERANLEPTKTEKVQKIWLHVLPPVAIGGLTIGAIIMAHRMSAARAAALAAAYGVSQKQLEEYKAKLAEKLGVQKYEKAKTEMSQERANQTPGSGAIVIYGDEVLTFDEPNGRYFKSTMEKILRAQNICNREILDTGFTDASRFYSQLDWPGTRWSDDVGWDKPFEVDISTIIVDDKPCLSIDFNPMPTHEYVRSHNSRYSS